MSQTNKRIPHRVHGRMRHQTHSISSQQPARRGHWTGARDWQRGSVIWATWVTKPRSICNSFVYVPSPPPPQLERDAASCPAALIIPAGPHAAVLIIFAGLLFREQRLESFASLTRCCGRRWRERHWQNSPRRITVGASSSVQGHFHRVLCIMFGWILKLQIHLLQNSNENIHLKEII